MIEMFYSAGHCYEMFYYAGHCYKMHTIGEKNNMESDSCKKHQQC